MVRTGRGLNRVVGLRAAVRRIGRIGLRLNRRVGRRRRLLLVLRLPWAVLVFLCVIRHWHFAPWPKSLIGLSAGYPTLYLAVAWGSSLWRWGNPGAQPK